MHKVYRLLFHLKDSKKYIFIRSKSQTVAILLFVISFSPSSFHVYSFSPSLFFKKKRLGSKVKVHVPEVKMAPSSKSVSENFNKLITTSVTGRVEPSNNFTSIKKKLLRIRYTESLKFLNRCITETLDCGIIEILR